MAKETLRRNIFQRLLGISATQPPKDPDCWSFEDGRITIDLRRTPELAQTSGALRLEGGDLPKRTLVVHSNDGRYHAFCNQCAHGKRRLDPVPGTTTVQCCSVGKSTYDYGGERLSGSAKGPITPFKVELKGEQVIVILA